MRHHDAKNFATNGVLRIARRMPRRFLMREDGSTTVFATVVFVLMVGVGGIAIDIMRFETQRVQLQYTLDRAVLAAASLSQTLDPQTVVESYFETSGLEDYRLSVEVQQAVNARRVSAHAEKELGTFFMQLFGQPILTSVATGVAQERVDNIEVSLVLDISGSMRNRDGAGVSQIDRLRPSAQSFVDTLLRGDRSEVTSISVVPYAGQVNPGATVFDLIGGQRETITYLDSDGDPVIALRDNARSSCVELNGTHFDRTSVPQGSSFPQVPHFMHWRIDNPTMDWGWCPLEGNTALGEASSTIQYLSGTSGDLNQYISRMRLHDGTGTQYGMLWGLWLLDPNSRWLVNELVDRGVVAERFRDRPAAYTNPDTIKVIVLMTDGAITEQYRPRFPNRTLAPLGEIDLNEIFLNHTRELERQNNGNDCNSQGCRVTYANVNTNRGQFYEACDRARENNIIVFTIAFNANATAREEMRNCASSAAHYYDVQGNGIDSAFQSIAGTISRLRLTN